jgi:hypothetical protein
MDGKTGPEKAEMTQDGASKAESACYGAIFGAQRAGLLARWPKMAPRDLQGAAQKSQHSMQIRVLRPWMARWFERSLRGLKI